MFRSDERSFGSHVELHRVEQSGPDGGAGFDDDRGVLLGKGPLGVSPLGQGPVDRREQVGLHFIPHHAAQGPQDEGQHGHVPQRHPQPDRAPSAEMPVGRMGESLHAAPVSCQVLGGCEWPVR